MAYEWENYRLANREVNTDKGSSGAVLDPFNIEDTYFRLNFLTGEIYPDPVLAQEIHEKVQVSIDILKLNKQKYCDYRLALMNMLDGDMERLKYESPFVFHALDAATPL